jgi:phage shock protein PspC (stress-responsive transcriptional regulator)
MKQVININYQGRVIPIETTAFDLLKNYIDSLKKYFSNEEGKDEIILDIENRIAELFQERLKTFPNCITDEDVNTVIKSMGRPEDFDDQHENASTPSSDSENLKSTASKRLFRDENNKLIGGVCSGLANYLNIDVVLIRVIFVVLAISFGIGLIPYLILWIAIPSTANGDLSAVRKKLYRDSDHKIIGGVCSGIAGYFGIDMWIPRVLFLLPAIEFIFNKDGDGFWQHSIHYSPGIFLVYIICWIVIPEALTTSEKLEMKGEKIDVNSIKKTITHELKGLEEKLKVTSNEAKAIVNKNSKGFFADLGNVITKIIRGIVKVIVFVIKAFVYTILAVIGIALIVTLLGLSIGSFTLFPMKDFILDGFWQNAFAWGTLFCFIIVAIVALITWIIKKIAGIKTTSKWLNVAFISLWIVGWISVFGLVTTLVKDFQISNTPNEINVPVKQPSGNKLIVMMNENKRFDNFDHNVQLGDIIDLYKDSFYIHNVTVRIRKSETDSFAVTMQKMARGRNRKSASETAETIHYAVSQNDSILYLDKGTTFSKNEKFRGQRIIITIYVPEGKSISIQKCGNFMNRNNLEIECSEWDNDIKNTTDFELNYGEIKEKNNQLEPVLQDTLKIPASTNKNKLIDSLLIQKELIDNKIKQLQ